MVSEERGGSGESLPPGQYAASDWQVLHYGPVPVFRAHTWDLRVRGETGAGECRWTWQEFDALPRVRVSADFHCVTRFSLSGVVWHGVPATALVEQAPPTEKVTHVMVWADYGYSANLPLADFLADTTLLATHREGERLHPEHGFPVRLVVPHLYGYKSVKWVREIEYLACDRRGFWEERGYHNRADPWAEQRYAYQEGPGDGPPVLP